MMMKKKRRVLIFVAASVLLVLVIWVIWGNTALEVNTYIVSNTGLPAAFDGFRIAQISDLHNGEIGKNNEKLLGMLRNAKPDVIAITGDLIDSYNTDVDAALRFIQEAVTIAPCYYVTGNHEARIAAYETLKQEMVAAGVRVLEDTKTEIELGTDRLTLIGVGDPNFQTGYLFGDAESIMVAKLQDLCEDTDGFTVLLSHRPELFANYVEGNIDLVLSGHAHGGQVRVPFIGGLVAPNQGLFPEYDGGLYTEGSTNMVVSRGVGNSLFPFRVNNRPEIVLIQLQKEEKS